MPKRKAIDVGADAPGPATRRSTRNKARKENLEVKAEEAKPVSTTPKPGAAAKMTAKTESGGVGVSKVGTTFIPFIQPSLQRLACPGPNAFSYFTCLQFQRLNIVLLSSLLLPHGAHAHTSRTRGRQRPPRGVPPNSPIPQTPKSPPQTMDHTTGS